MGGTVCSISDSLIPCQSLDFHVHFGLEALSRQICTLANTEYFWIWSHQQCLLVTSIEATIIVQYGMIVNGKIVHFELKA